MLKGLYHMQIPVCDLGGATDWYVTNLGFKIDGPPDGRHAFLSLPEGPFLMLWKTGEEARANFSVADEVFPVLLYRTERIHELHDKLQSLGVRITFFQDEGFGWVLKFFDPEGNMWGAIQDN